MHPTARRAPRRAGLLLAILVSCLVAVAGTPHAQGFNPGGEQSVPSKSGDYLKDWQWWWYFNKEQYLGLRRRIFTTMPRTGANDFFIGIGEREIVVDPTKLTAYELRFQIVPALLAVFEEDDPPGGVVSAVLFALAKIGPAGELADSDPFDQIILDYLDDSSKGLRERAVVALGILGKQDSVPALISLLRNTRDGQRLVDKTEVPREMRAFAAYSLGLIGHRYEDQGLRRTILAELVEVLEGPKFATRDIKTACMLAFSLMPLDVREWEPMPRRVGTRPLPWPDPLASRQGQLRWLLRYLKEFRHFHELIRVHAPIALARLLPGADPRMKEEVARPLLKLVGRYANEVQQMRQSCAIALGEIGDCDKDDVDRDIVKTLVRLTQKSDQVTRRYAFIGLGRVASTAGEGEEPFAQTRTIVRALLRELGPLGESRQHSWAALSMGVMMRDLLDARNPVPTEPLAPMHKALKNCRTPLDIGAYSLALGLVRHLDSLQMLEVKLELFNIEAQKGLVALSMGMMGHFDAEEPLFAVLRESDRRSEQLELVSTALALLGAEERVPVLMELYEEAGSEASRGPVIAALGRSGDRRVITDLVELLRDIEGNTQGLLQATATALGNVADKDEFLWRSLYSTNVNYAAAPPTLFGGGILDMY